MSALPPMGIDTKECPLLYDEFPSYFGTRVEAARFLMDAVNDYALEYDRFQSGSLEFIDPDSFRALQAWDTRPKLPAPEWPSGLEL